MRHIKQTLLDYRKAGTLGRVRMVLLTNCTFDGLVYDVERVMMECLAIKPDLVFLWDEAWFAFARCHPIYRQRTGMATAKKLYERFADPAYAQQYADFKDKAEDAFHEAYMTHTSTSLNYQFLASLDVGRRQVELEGYELVQRQLDLAMSLREQVVKHRQHAFGGSLPDRGPGQDRQRRRPAHRRHERHRAPHPRHTSALAHARVTAAAGLLGLPLRLPGPQRRRSGRDPRRRHPQRVFPLVRRRQLRLHRHGRCGVGDSRRA